MKTAPLPCSRSAAWHPTDRRHADQGIQSWRPNEGKAALHRTNRGGLARPASTYCPVGPYTNAGLRNQRQRSTRGAPARSAGSSLSATREHYNPRREQAQGLATRDALAHEPLHTAQRARWACNSKDDFHVGAKGGKGRATRTCTRRAPHRLLAPRSVLSSRRQEQHRVFLSTLRVVTPPLKSILRNRMRPSAASP